MPLPKITLILSMHRSGSSTVAQLIHQLGVHLGDPLHEGREDNPDGFWEYIPLVHLHERMLAFSGCTWYLPGKIPAVELLLAHFGAEARQLVAKMDAAGLHWAWKDPRMPLFLAFWMEILKHREVWFVIAQRNPDAVVASLTRRDGMPESLSKALWVYSIIHILKSRSHSSKCLVLSYESILWDTTTTLRRLYHFFQPLIVNQDEAELLSRMSGIIRPELAHFKKKQPDSEDNALAWLAKAFDRGEDQAIMEIPESYLNEALQVIQAHQQAHFRLETKSYLIRFYYRCSTDTPTFTFLSAHEGVRENVVFKFPVAKTLVQFRLEVLNTHAIVTLKQVNLYLNNVLLPIPLNVTSNASQQIESTYFFDTNSPALFFAADAGGNMELDEVHVAFEYHQIGMEASQELYRQTKNQFQYLQATHTDLQTAHATLQTTHADLQTAHTDLQTAHTTLQTTHADLQTTYATLQTTYATLQTTHVALQLEHNSSVRLFKQILRILYRKLSRAGGKLIRRLGFHTNQRRAESNSTQAYKRQVLDSVSDWYDLLRYTIRRPWAASYKKDYVPFRTYPVDSSPTVRILAFYLPQFHAIPENDAWWGEGFTEWTNVKPATPQFKGHYQPREPDTLGYYNLLDPEIQRKQVALAKNYGISGFCFHFYWFQGNRLLEAPILQYAQNKDLDLPFCLSWANENWSRRWDGKAEDLLIQQAHSPEDDLAFIAYISTYFKDSRYIQIDGRPLLLVYRPGILPNARETTDRWRQWCRENGIGELYIACSQSFDAVDPVRYGMDAALEFPPNNLAPAVITDQVKPLHTDFGMVVYDWRSLLLRSKEYINPGYKLFRGVCPSWDNTARRKNKGVAFLHTHPARYQKWLLHALLDTKKRFALPDERLVFINAWNEWAEGAYLEPDKRYGYAFLEATRKAITTFERMRNKAAPLSMEQRWQYWLKVQRLHLDNLYLRLIRPGTKRSNPSNLDAPFRGKLLVVSHDAYRNGAQIIALEIVRHLTQDFKLEVEIVLLGIGPLKSQFETLARVHDLSEHVNSPSYLDAFARQLALRGWDKAIVNTTVSGIIIPSFARHGIRCISLVHELPKLIASAELHEAAKNIARYSTYVVFPHQIVQEGFSALTSLSAHKMIIHPQGIYTRNKGRFHLDASRHALRAELGIPETAKIILGAGQANHRKGIDFFITIGRRVLETLPDTYMVWIGLIDWNIQQRIHAELETYSQRDRFIFPGFQSDVSQYFAGSDIYALTSREDPFPSVALEAFDVAIPVVAFKGTGGIAALVQAIGSGETVPAFDVIAFSDTLIRLLGAKSLRMRMGHLGQQHLDNALSFRKYVFFIAGQLGITLPKVSVVVPNYNYAQYLLARLESIRKQTFPIYELIILDDDSQDKSREVILDWMTETKMECRLVFCSANSGSVLLQWKRGVELATGDYIWIAEADDLSDPDFLETVYAPMQQHPEVVLSYCESKQIDESGLIIAEHYHAYLSDVSDSRWQQDSIRKGVKEIQEALAVLNTIPNVSGVLFRRNVLQPVLAAYVNQLLPYKRAFDFLIYIRILERGDIAYSRHPANRHRRHTQSVIGKSDYRALYEEITEIQQLVATAFDVPESVLKLAASYRTKLCRQFGFEDEIGG